MGTMCAHPTQKQQCNQTVDTNKRNFVQLQGQLGSNSHIELVLGTSYQIQGIIVSKRLKSKHLSNCDALKEYASDYSKVMTVVQNNRKTFMTVATNKTSPYKKLLLCILPHYKSEDREAYIQLLTNVMREVMEEVKETAVELINTMEGVSTLPNQMVLSVVLGEVAGRKGGFKILLVTNEKKMMSFYRFQLIKTQQFHMTTP